MVSKMASISRFANIFLGTLNGAISILTLKSPKNLEKRRSKLS